MSTLTARESHTRSLNTTHIWELNLSNATRFDTYKSCFAFGSMILSSKTLWRISEGRNNRQFQLESKFETGKKSYSGDLAKRRTKIGMISLLALRRQCRFRRNRNIIVYKFITVEPNRKIPLNRFVNPIDTF